MWYDMVTCLWGKFSYELHVEELPDDFFFVFLLLCVWFLTSEQLEKIQI